MLPENKLQFSDYSSLYDLIIPKDNLLRRINDIVDFSFVRENVDDPINIKPRTWPVVEYIKPEKTNEELYYFLVSLILK